MTGSASTLTSAPRWKGLNALRLVLDIDQSADGRVEGFVQPVGAQAPTPFSGVLELVAAVEGLLLVGNGPPGLDKASGGQGGRRAH
jgi:hypothetical protein